MKKIFLFVLLVSSNVFAGGSEVTNPWPWDSQPSITLEGRAAETMISQLKKVDSVFAQTLTLSKAQCTVDGFGGAPVEYYGKIAHQTSGQSSTVILNQDQAEILCDSLIQAGIMKYQSPNPSGMYSLSTEQISCSKQASDLCQIWLL